MAPLEIIHEDFELSNYDKIFLDEKETDKLLSHFIQPRKTVPVDAENTIVSRTKDYYKKDLIGRYVTRDQYEKLVEELSLSYYKTIIQPGESVGIIAGQCIGERTTQSSLNTFHSAGLDTGATSQIDNLQNIINSSKIKKRNVRRYVRTSLFLHERPKTLADITKLTFKKLVPITFDQLIKNIQYQGQVNIPSEFGLIKFPKGAGVCKLSLDLEIIFRHRITRGELVDLISLYSKHVFCVPYSSLEEDAKTVDLYFVYGEKNDRKEFFDVIRKIKPMLICGIQGVGFFVYTKTNDGEWYVECMSDGIDIFFKHQDIYDMTRIISNSVHDMNDTFGIMIAQQIIIDKCQEILTGVNECHFRILASKMTKNGTIDPLTRYTMRNNTSPLSKASFEESFETFLKAAKFNEVENFKSISSSIICGKKPKVGTYNSEILMDPKFYF